MIDVVKNQFLTLYRLHGNNDYEYGILNVYFVENLRSRLRRTKMGFEPGTLSPIKHGTLVNLCMSQLNGQI